ncbi:MAG TPA: HEAT repeat domain-containing protein, partial [Anaeromyxobacteraceae bacterium]|nr:HEAT repeat domain-containing protein [Anaeromyxobacteraceae bacterium]
MSSSLFSRFSLTAFGVAALLFTASCTTPPSAPPPELSALTYDGSKQALADLDREIAAAGQDNAQLTAIAKRLIGTLRNPEATFAARQAVAQRLGLFPAATLLADGNAALFANLLKDDAQVDLARLALDQVPGSAVDALFADALETAAGKARLAIVQSLGNRRVSAAAAPLSPILSSDDPALAAAAAKALGQIGTADALAALRAAQNVNAPTVVEATLTAAHHVGGPEAARAFQQIADATEAPAHLRAAAFRSLLILEPADAPAHI